MKFYIVDVFAEQKYQGNQLAVLVPDRVVSDAEMQQIARETNYSETTFITSGKRENGGYDVRIFTPDVEVPFAGHPTLGTAYVINELMEKGKSDKIILNLKVGSIPVSVDKGDLVMRQNEPVFGKTIEDRTELAEILKIGEADIRTDYPIQEVSTGLACVVVPLKSVEALERCAINHDRYRRFLADTCSCNLLVFAPDTEYDLRVRVFMFVPGYLEDPATGSANGNLAGYLLRHNFFNGDKIQYTVSQGREIKRPSVLRIKATLSDEKFDINVGGKTCLVAEGDWL